MSTDPPRKPHVFGVQRKPCGCEEGLQMTTDAQGRDVPSYVPVRYCEEHAGEKERQKAAREGEA